MNVKQNIQNNPISESTKFLTEQIITYIGNKRALLDFIGKGICFAKNELKKEKIEFLDIFSGSGVVARYAKAHSNLVIANDLELYSQIINECYLSNFCEEKWSQIKIYHNKLLENIDASLKSGFITQLYSPKNDKNIKHGERVFYTRENAMFIDTMRSLIDQIVPKNLQQFFIAPLLYESSVHSNTGGVFKGFYKNRKGIGEFGGEGKNALSRIMGKISLPLPVLSNFKCDFNVFRSDAYELAKNIGKIDVCYLDPPYNQHPYGSNYFMLNLIANNQFPDKISAVSGIPKDWNRSIYNKPSSASEAFFELIGILQAKIIIISFNSEGFISREDFLKNLAKHGSVQHLEQKYNTFRASRNLKNRNIYVNEDLYILKK